jgi:Domain of unknown function (DUF4389)
VVERGTFASGATRPGGAIMDAGSVAPRGGGGSYMNDTSTPLRLEGQLDPALSRWLWLVKWILLIPHYIVLAILWVAFLLVSIVAFFAILITGRYPMGMFDFNVGVLRWSWRVAYYGYSALGTDRYPPFSIGHTPDYPARLEVAYPEQLSRGLVLVKWWLLAIPQYILVGIFTRGLIGILTFFAAVANLFTGRYPPGIYDFVLGLNRWVTRVCVYAALMTDAYPPFRLDAGGAEPPADQQPQDSDRGPTNETAAPVPPRSPQEA